MPATTPEESPLAAEYNPSLLDITLEQNNRIAAVIRSEVEQQLKDAAGRMGGDPHGSAIRPQADPRTSHEGPGATRPTGLQLLGRIERALREAARRCHGEGADGHRAGEQSRRRRRTAADHAIAGSQPGKNQAVDGSFQLADVRRPYCWPKKPPRPKWPRRHPNSPIAVSSVLDARMTRYMAAST